MDSDANNNIQLRNRPNYYFFNRIDVRQRGIRRRHNSINAMVDNHSNDPRSLAIMRALIGRQLQEL